MKKLLSIILVLIIATPIFADDFQTTLQKAEQGDADAQVNLGLMYFYGDGVAKDYTMAKMWIKKAAENEDSSYNSSYYDDVERAINTLIKSGDTFTKEGVTYKLTSPHEVEVIGAKKNLSHVEIPEYVDYVDFLLRFRVTSIGDKAFRKYSKLIDIQIANSVKNIGDEAFYGCSSLPEIYIPEGVTSIGDKTFYGCFSLYDIYIPEGVTSIGDSAFYDCYSLESVDIPNSVTEIGDGAFCSCYSLESVDIPNSVTSIGNDAFCYCSRLQSVTIPNSVTDIGYAAFCFCYSLESISLPDSISIVPPFAVMYCDNLDFFHIPDNVTTIGYGAFAGCRSLSYIKIPKSVTSIESIAFTGTELYNDTSNWEDGALYIDSCLIKVTKNMEGAYAIKPGTRLIAYEAFGRCKSLTSLTIPSSVTHIGCGVFYKCKSLKAIDFAGTKEQWEKIQKDGYWNEGSKLQVIRCIDGEVAL